MLFIIQSLTMMLQAETPTGLRMNLAEAAGFSPWKAAEFYRLKYSETTGNLWTVF